jgi:hypothetical protein
MSDDNTSLEKTPQTTQGPFFTELRPISDEYVHFKSAKRGTWDLIGKHIKPVIAGAVLAALGSLLTGQIALLLYGVLPATGAYLLFVIGAFLYNYWQAPRSAYNKSQADIVIEQEKVRAKDSELQQALVETQLLRSHLQNLIPKDRPYITGRFKDVRIDPLTKPLNLVEHATIGTEVLILVGFVNEAPTPTTIQNFKLRLIYNEGEPDEFTRFATHPAKWPSEHIANTQNLFSVIGRCADLQAYIGDTSQILSQGLRIEGVLDFLFRGLFTNPKRAIRFFAN